MLKAHESCSEKPPDIGGEVNKHRGERTKLDNSREGCARIGPAQKVGNHAEVSRTAYGQKFGQALDEAQKKVLKKGHQA